MGFVVYLGYIMMKHCFGCIKICNDPVLQGTDRHDALSMASYDISGFLSHGDDLVSVLIYGDDGGFIEHNTLPSKIDECICGAEIHGQIFGKEAQQSIKHE